MEQNIRQCQAIHEVNTRREMRIGDRAPFTYAAKATPVRHDHFNGERATLVLLVGAVMVAAIGWFAVELIELVRGVL